MKARIIVMPKKTVLDPQGKTVKHALESMGFAGIKDVRVIFESILAAAAVR